jgi:hypothetical protein
MHFCATLRSAVTRLREKKQKNIKRKKSQSRYISRMRGAPLSNRLQWKFAHRFRSPTLINRVNFCGCRLRGLVFAKGRI